MLSIPFFYLKKLEIKRELKESQLVEMKGTNPAITNLIEAKDFDLVSLISIKVVNLIIMLIFD